MKNDLLFTFFQAIITAGIFRRNFHILNTKVCGSH